MSNLAISAAHLVAIPARYAVGKWNNLSTSTMLVFNATELGLHTLLRGIQQIVHDKFGLHIPHKFHFPLTLTIRTVSCLAAVYVTAKLTDPIPLKAAALSSLASAVSVMVAIVVVEWKAQHQ